MLIQRYVSVSSVCLLILCLGFQGMGQPAIDTAKHFEKDGLTFDYVSSWELNDQSNAAAQQLTLIDKTLDAQVMIIVLRSAVTNSKQEEQAKASVVEPSIAELLKQYETAGIKVEQAPLQVELAGVSAEGKQLRFAVDGQPGMTDICWVILNKRLVQLFFIRPEKNSAKATECWDRIRASLVVTLPTKKGDE